MKPQSFLRFSVPNSPGLKFVKFSVKKGRSHIDHLLKAMALRSLTQFSLLADVAALLEDLHTLLARVEKIYIYIYVYVKM